MFNWRFLYDLTTVDTQSKWLLSTFLTQYLRRLEIDEEQYIQSKAAENPGHKGDNFLFIFFYDWLLCLCDDYISNGNNQYYISMINVEKHYYVAFFTIYIPIYEWVKF